jgi:hypothetical protein
MRLGSSFAADQRQVYAPVDVDSADFTEGPFRQRKKMQRFDDFEEVRCPHMPSTRCRDGGWAAQTYHLDLRALNKEVWVPKTRCCGAGSPQGGQLTMLDSSTEVASPSAAQPERPPAVRCATTVTRSLMRARALQEPSSATTIERAASMAAGSDEALFSEATVSVAPFDAMGCLVSRGQVLSADRPPSPDEDFTEQGSEVCPPLRASRRGPHAPCAAALAAGARSLRAGGARGRRYAVPTMPAHSAHAPQRRSCRHVSAAWCPWAR